MDVSVILDAIIILTGACFAQILLIENSSLQRLKAFIVKHAKLKNETYEKIEDVIVPLIGTTFVLFFEAPQNILAQAGAGLTWSTTIVVIANKFKKKT